MATNWTGASSNDPTNAGNWDNGVPAFDNGAIIDLTISPVPDNWPDPTFVESLTVTGAFTNQSFLWNNAVVLGQIQIDNVFLIRVGGSAAMSWPANTDVRDGVPTGNPVTGAGGVLNLPAEADVKLGVQYDQATKTGTYAATGGRVQSLTRGLVD